MTTRICTVFVDIFVAPYEAPATAKIDFDILAEQKETMLATTVSSIRTLSMNAEGKQTMWAATEQVTVRGRFARLSAAASELDRNNLNRRRGFTAPNRRYRNPD